MRKIMIKETAIRMENDYEKMLVRIPDEIRSKLSNVTDTAAVHNCDCDFIKTTKTEVKHVLNYPEHKVVESGEANATFIFNTNGLHVFVDLNGLKGKDNKGDTLTSGTMVIDFHFSRRHVLRVF